MTTQPVRLSRPAGILLFPEPIFRARLLEPTLHAPLLSVSSGEERGGLNRLDFNSNKVTVLKHDLRTELHISG